MSRFLKLLLLLTLPFTFTYAQSAVYFCTETGAYGYAYGYSSKSAAEAAAMNACYDAGGTNPTYITSTSARGFGAIAIGENYDGNRVIGVAIGFDTLWEALENAKKQCESYGGREVCIRTYFNDR